MNITRILGIRVITDPSQYEDQMVLFYGFDGAIYLSVGTKSLPEHVKEARVIVRRGLADVLNWLGEPVEPAYGLERVKRFNSSR